MLDIKFIRENPESRAKGRGGQDVVVDVKNY